MITIIPIEPLSEAHGMLIVQAFNKHFVDGGGQEDGNGDGDGWGNGGERPEEWTVDESNQALTGC
jgi:hypothetical protein